MSTRSTGAIRCAVGMMAALSVSACEEGPRSIPEAPSSEAPPSAATQVQPLVQGLVAGPDLVVTEVSGPSTVQSGMYFDATVVVCNQGTEAAQPSQGALYLSADDVLVSAQPLTPRSDKVLTPFNVGPLAVGECWGATARVRADTNIPGAYYLGAIINDGGGGAFETDRTNNRRIGNMLGIGDGPDLVVTGITAPASSTNASFQGQATVCNRGTQPSPSTDLQVLLSADAVITSNTPQRPTSDQLLGNVTVEPLQPGACLTVPYSGAPVPVLVEGAYHVGALVDPSQRVAELIEENNTKAGARVGIGNAPDFVVSEVTGPVSLAPGQPLTASVRVCNQGTQSGNVPVELYLSPDTVITPQVPPELAPDLRLATSDTGTLEAGACRTLTFTATAGGLANGTYYLGTLIDPFRMVRELDTENNTTLSRPLSIGIGPDLVVASVTSPSSVAPGAPLTAGVQVCNQGTSPSGPSAVAVVLSTGVAITLADFPLGTVNLNALAPNECQTGSVTANVQTPPGTWFVGAIADASRSVTELQEGNNTRKGTRVAVGMLPDLVVTAITAPPSLLPGQPLSASLTLCNQGTLPVASPTTAELYLSKDAVITPNSPGRPAPDFLVGIATLQEPLAVGACREVVVQSTPTSVAPDVYYLGAVVDVFQSVPELFEDNNVTTGPRIGIGDAPDFIVASVSAPATVPWGTPFTVAFEVCNQGTRQGATLLELFLSEDTLITPPTQPGVPADYPVGITPVFMLAPGQCQTGSQQVHSGGFNGTAFHVGVVADPGRAIIELIEDNNSKASSRVVMAP
ncbi:hypothetical protein LZ198_08080 [Myxococcus sp. K15C18031901]|uniref:CARDB domain-containing protein n=1 Tax=Myxococcus dinghuensis TaxID=2906761 RepID=UPI0020A7D3CE|nr:CARDB domain-containing protein [Myxococcus dinghuensis]MCP3098832.1 hypothetical protein [Myxococcus dinghuensis]